MAEQINKTVPLRPGLLASTLKDTGTNSTKADPSSVWGPPSPGQTWQDYADAVQQVTQSSSTNSYPQINETVQIKEQAPRPSSVISTVQQLDTSNVKQDKTIADDVNSWIKRFMNNPADLAGVLFDTGGVFDPAIIETGSRDAAKAQQDEHGTMQYIPLDKSESDPYDDIYNQLIEEDEARSIIAQREQPTVDSIMSRLFDPSYSPKDRSFMSVLGHAGRVRGQDNGMYGNQLSNSMTGSQYIRYREAGIPGRPIEDIDPNKVYSKLEERNQYGFAPYMPDEDAKMQLLREDIESGPSRFFDSLANARTDNTDYSITIDGQKISGKNFDKEFSKYIDETNKILNDSANYKMSKEEAGPNAVGFKVSGYKVRLDDGSEIEIPSSSYSILYAPQYTDEDPSVVILFDDTGDVVTFDSVEDYENSLEYSSFIKADNDDEAIVWVDIPDLVTEEGVSISYNNALDIGQGGGDRDYGKWNINKPSYLLDDFWNENGFNTDDLVPKMLDIAAGSAPYFTPYTSIPLAISNALSATHGIDPAQQTKDGSERLRENLNDDIYASSILGNLVMPATEIGLGRIGGNAASNLMNWLSKKTGRRAFYPMAEHAIGTLGEGFEEIPANLVEDYMVNGLQELYANPLKDDQGNDIADSSGHILKDKNTSVGDRWNNFWQDAPEAFTAGTLLGGLFGLPELPYAIRDTMDQSAKNHIAKNQGAGIYRPGKIAEGLWSPLTPDIFVKER